MFNQFAQLNPIIQALLLVFLIIVAVLSFKVFANLTSLTIVIPSYPRTLDKVRRAGGDRRRQKQVSGRGRG